MGDSIWPHRAHVNKAPKTEFPDDLIERGFLELPPQRDCSKAAALKRGEQQLSYAGRQLHFAALLNSTTTPARSPSR